MKTNTAPYLILLISALILSGCHTPEPVDYKTLELTAALHLTQTFEALPTATNTFTPIPTNTPVPTATPTETPEPEEDFLVIRQENPDESFMITRDGGSEDAFMISRGGSTEPPATPEPTATVYFPDKADFISALPSPNQFIPNQHFYLTWQIKNIGTSTWSGKYRFYYSDGIQLADQTNYAINEIVEPGGVLTITMPATAPDSLGTYKTVWTLENPDGIPFYYLNFIAIVGEQTFITNVPELSPSSTPSALSWMCSDPERSLIQGDGCQDYCSMAVVQQMLDEGKICYANGEMVDYDE